MRGSWWAPTEAQVTRDVNNSFCTAVKMNMKHIFSRNHPHKSPLLEQLIFPIDWWLMVHSSNFNMHIILGERGCWWEVGKAWNFHCSHVNLIIERVGGLKGYGEWTHTRNISPPFVWQTFSFQLNCNVFCGRQTSLQLSAHQQQKHTKKSFIHPKITRVKSLNIIGKWLWINVLYSMSTVDFDYFWCHRGNMWSWKICLSKPCNIAQKTQYRLLWRVYKSHKSTSDPFFPLAFL